MVPYDTSCANQTISRRKKVTFAEVERAVGISNGQIRRWDRVSPKSENLKKVADYFGVTTDFLLGKEPSAKMGK